MEELNKVRIHLEEEQKELKRLGSRLNDYELEIRAFLRKMESNTDLLDTINRLEQTKGELLYWKDKAKEEEKGKLHYMSVSNQLQRNVTQGKEEEKRLKKIIQDKNDKIDEVKHYYKELEMEKANDEETLRTYGKAIHEKNDTITKLQDKIQRLEQQLMLARDGK